MYQTHKWNMLDNTRKKNRHFLFGALKGTAANHGTNLMSPKIGDISHWDTFCYW